MNGETQLVGVLGWPVSHSKSPLMQNAAFKHCRLNWAYVPLAVSPHHTLTAAIEGLKACGFRGANVTVPYKEEAAALVDSASDDAKTIGAVNTLIIRPDGSVRGENTDAPGFLAHLAEQNIEVKGEDVTVIGAGGAARAIVFALVQAGAGRVTVINRNEARAAELALQLGAHALSWSHEAFEAATKSALVVNTTSLGLHENDPIPWLVDIQFSRNQAVYDAIYRRTPFLDMAISHGARGINGSGMLLWQGAIAFKMWTGVDAPVEVMREELENA